VSEPEDLIAEGALLAAVVVRDVWRRRSHDADEDGRPTLAHLRRRLELLSAAVFPGTREILAAEPPAPATFLWRLAHGSPHPGTALASTDGERIWLPRELDGSSPVGVVERYRLLVLEQAARAARGTWRETSIDPLIRDLYLLCESAAIDAQLARSLPGLAGALRGARSEALAARPAPRRALPAELIVEETLQTILRADLLCPPHGLPESDTPARSMRWARSEAEALRRRHGRYRGIAPVMLWGGMPPPPDDACRSSHGDTDHDRRMPHRMRALLRRPRARAAAGDEDDASTGTWIVRTDDPQEKAEDAGGLQRPTDRDADADPGELADALSELPELRIVRTPQRVSETLVSESPLRRIAAVEHPRGLGGVVYPEWDWQANAYRPHGAIVRSCDAPTGDPAWAARVLERHAALVRAVRRDFERLRSRRSARLRQPHGSDVDIDGYIVARSDARGTGAMSDRYYVDAGPRRRDAAIMLLLDASASTESWVARDRRVIDVEKEALLIVCEALRILGDQHAALAFSGEGPERVQVSEVVGFGDAAGVETVRARIAALEPDGFTRLGAALRHGSAMLAGQTAHRRLLLLLSDGRPNDVDVYEGRYGIEDTRAAVIEARSQGVHCFCLTVDREAPQYAPRIFGAPYFAVLPRAERLPVVLLALLRRLIRGD
jgi:nitric oxide reductase NorD protein